MHWKHSIIISKSDVPEEKLWVEVGEGGRINPYGVHKTVNQDHVEVTNSVSEDGRVKRWVFFKDGEHRAWVQVAAEDEYGYEVQPEERLSEAKREALELKHAAIRDGSDVVIEDALAFLETADSKQLPHAVIAVYYAAKEDPRITDEGVDSLREIVHEHTNHVDTSHKPTVRKLLGETVGDERTEGD
jgi:hypothetical protein